MIDFEKFTMTQTFIAPVLNRKCQCNRKKYTVESENGWYRITAKGNFIVERIPISVEMESFPAKNIIKGYTYGNQIVFQNFDVAKRKAGTDMMAPLEFNQSATFSSIEAIIWEDKHIYYYRPNYADVAIYEIKSYFDSEEDIHNAKGVSPELRTLYLFHDIERQQLQELQKAIQREAEQKQREKELEQFKQTLQGRLITTFNRAGAQIVSYSVLRDTITVDWKLLGSNQEFNSIIELETFKVREAGYCLSGHDKEHTAQSMVMLAQDYEERGLIYKTRY
jgi:hypothetical protein